MACENCPLGVDRHAESSGDLQLAKLAKESLDERKLAKAEVLMKALYERLYQRHNIIMGR